MKKIFGILFFVFFFSGNASASSEKIYLICETKATDTTKNTGKMISHITDTFKIINVNYISIDKKNDKIKIVIYEQGPSKFWFKMKPEELMSFLGKSDIAKTTEYKDGHFLFTAKDKIAGGDFSKHTFDIYKKENKWMVEGTYYTDFGEENGIFNFPFKGDCGEFNKKDFLKKRKTGIANS
tara:strand:- start:69 stop:611 length:543 start_codon:yes stop_codon:yes gene_type:complete